MILIFAFDFGKEHSRAILNNTVGTKADIAGYYQGAQDAVASKRKAPKTCVARISAHIISYFYELFNRFGLLQAV